MSHPQPPFGPQDPNQQPAEPPTQAFPTAPMPPVPGDPYAPQPPVSGAPQPPYPPVLGEPQPPYPPQPPAGGGPYPPPGGPYPPAPGQPFGVPPAKKSNKTVWIIVGIAAAVLLLLCCGGGIFAVYNGFKKVQDTVESLPTPGITADPFDETPTGAPKSTPKPGPTGETFNMRPGETLVITDDQGTIEITVSKFHTKDKACQAYLPEPKNGIYLIADVTAEVTKGKASINPFYFSWIDADGNEENGLGGALSGCGKLLGSGINLAAGSKRTGQLVFDVKDTNGNLEYEHQLETAGSWKP
ncbi:DUF4352 domain-containing protein [Micromonospora sp. NPDC006766]|uniref:DUF4352 domain-containing protein n=1 Tax=Micromonospora sp. NPDC006766 TaxID=3154778 RepID=UPI00340D4626